MKVKLLHRVWLFVTPWTVARQPPPSMDSPGKNTGVGSHFLLQGIFLTQGSNLGLLHCKQMLYREPPGKSCVCVYIHEILCVCVCVCVCVCIHTRFPVCMCACMLSCFSCVWLFVTLWTVGFQAPLSMGILQGWILEWVAMPSSRGSSQSRDQTQVSCIAGGFFSIWAIFTIWATREALVCVYTHTHSHTHTHMNILYTYIHEWYWLEIPEIHHPFIMSSFYTTVHRTKLGGNGVFNKWCC